MSVISKQIEGYLARSSWIRRMFEAGIALKKEHGADSVCDFSLGNPDLPAPLAVKKELERLADISMNPFTFGYMPNAGHLAARKALAEYLSAEQETLLSAEDVLLTCGAAGAINVFLKAVIDSGDEVLAIAPYFVEYAFYAENHGASFKTVSSNLADFSPDIKALEAAINPATRVLIINSPNNPTGQIYTSAQINAVAELLTRKSVEYGRSIYLVSDEPYRFLTYDNADVAPVLCAYEHAVVVGSFSKSLGLAGERVGYLALAPNMAGKEKLMGACILTNRILGFVNAPVVGQYLMSAALGSQVDVSIYAKRREAMAKVLSAAGIEFVMPRGAFYFFPKAPGGDDLAFVDKLVKELVLVVPGTGFGCPGHFRLSFCVDEKVIERSKDKFIRAVQS